MSERPNPYRVTVRVEGDLPTVVRRLVRPHDMNKPISGPEPVGSRTRRE